MQFRIAHVVIIHPAHFPLELTSQDPMDTVYQADRILRKEVVARINPSFHVNTVEVLASNPIQSVRTHIEEVQRGLTKGNFAY
jgi:hypothetical protein